MCIRDRARGMANFYNETYESVTINDILLYKLLYDWLLYTSTKEKSEKSIVIIVVKIL